MGSLWNRSGTIERYADDLKAGGAKAYFFEGGTTTPLTVYHNSAQTSSHPHPVVADANGRWPNTFVPFIVSYDVRVTTADGVQLSFTEQIPNANPADEVVSVDPEDLVQTGMIHAELVNSPKTGYVRLNGRTMGSAASGATERANDDTLNLYSYLWTNVTDTICPVSTGRGATPAADFAANKTITLPTCQGTGLVGLDDMGGGAANAFTGLTFVSGGATTVGSLIGNNHPTFGGIATTGPDVAHTHPGVTAGGASTGNDTPTHTHQQAIVGSGTGNYNNLGFVRLIPGFIQL